MGHLIESLNNPVTFQWSIRFAGLGVLLRMHAAHMNPVTLK